MANLMASLSASGNALDVFERSLEVVQENIDNVSTPGYARQQLGLEALPFSPNSGLIGGVRAGDLISARDQYAERDVRQHVAELGYFGQKADSLSQVESLFDVTGKGGVDSALNSLIQSFSAWSTTPNDPAARQAVIDQANSFAATVRTVSSGLSSASADANRAIDSTVSQINQLAAKLRDYNAERLQGAQDDPGLDAKTQATLEDLSQLVDVTATRQADGSITVLLGGQTPLVMGDQQYDLAFDAPSAARVLDSSGRDVTDQASQGKLGALLDFRNRFVPGMIGDTSQPGTLNRLARAVADRVNQLLTSGQVSSGPPPTPGIPLFTYDSTNPSAAAATLEVNSQITPDQLAAIDPGPPEAANGIALSLASLNSTATAANQIDGMSYVQFYSSIVAGLGRELSEAQNSQDLATQQTNQSRSLRAQISGVSLDDEAVHLIAFQQAYQAAAKTVSVLNDLTQTLMNMMQ